MYLINAQNKLLMVYSASVPASDDGYITPINMTNHTYWNLSGDFKEPTIADHSLKMNCYKTLEMDEN